MYFLPVFAFLDACFVCFVFMHFCSCFKMPLPVKILEIEQYFFILVKTFIFLL